MRAALPIVAAAAVRRDARPTPVTTPTGGFKPVPKNIAGARPQPARTGELPTGPRHPDQKPTRHPAGNAPARPRLKPSGPDPRPLIIALLIAALGSALAVVTWFAL